MLLYLLTGLRPFSLLCQQLLLLFHQLKLFINVLLLVLFLLANPLLVGCFVLCHFEELLLLLDL